MRRLRSPISSSPKKLSADLKPVLRRAVAEDAAALALVAGATLLDTFAGILSGRDLVAHCAANNTPAKFAAWTSDPAIRDFRGLQENDWDFNAPDSIPGFGTFKSDVEIRELAARVFGTHNEASEPIPQVAPADRPTEPAGEEAAAALDKVQVAEAMPGAAMSDDASAAAAQQSDDSPEPVVTARKHGGALPH